MNLLKYVPSQSSTPIELDGMTTWIDTADEIRSRKWQYTLGARELYSVRRIAREVGARLLTDRATADTIRRVTDADVAAEIPGELVYNNEWHQKAYIIGSELDFVHGGMVGLSLDILLMDGKWWRLAQQSFYPQTEESDYEYLDFDFDFEFDLHYPPPASEVNIGALQASPIKLTLYGAAVNPYVIIGDNRYEVDYSIPAGAYVVVDGKESTITMTQQNGTTVDLFSYGLRGSGEGGGEYIFEPVQPGEQSVSWDNSFGFDLGWYEEEGAPPWQVLQS